MSERLPEFRLGIIGGCMSHQRGIALNELYHRRLDERMRAELGVRLRPRIARGFASDYRTRLERLAADGPLDGVMVHLRVTVVSSARPIVSEIIDGRTRHSMHPELFRRTHRRPDQGPRGEWRADAYDGSDDLQDAPLPGRRVAGFRIRDVNYALGVLMGLDDWAIDEELLRLSEVESVCRARGIPLFVLGPTPITNGYWQARIVEKFNARIRRALAGRDLPYALVPGPRDAGGRHIIRADGFHLTAEGHQIVADLLFGLLSHPVLLARERPLIRQADDSESFRPAQAPPESPRRSVRPSSRTSRPPHPG